VLQVPAPNDLKCQRLGYCGIGKTVLGLLPTPAVLTTVLDMFSQKLVQGTGQGDKFGL
jgi:hypothetical protein